MTEDEMRDHIRARCGDQWGGVTALARELGVRPQKLHNVLGPEQRSVDAKLAELLGYRRVETVTFEKLQRKRRVA